MKLKCFIILINLYSVACVEYGNYEYIQDYHTGLNKSAGLRRPCVLTNINCISHILVENQLCNPALNTDTLILYLAHCNTTLIRRNAQIVGLNNYKIKEFFINDHTDEMVLEVDFPQITVYSVNPNFIFHIRGKESVVTSDYALFTYRDLSLTLTTNIKQNKLTNGHVFTYINDVNPPISMGPKLLPTDVDGLKGYTKMLKDMPLTLSEMFVTQGPDFMNRFLQTVICGYQAK